MPFMIERIDRRDFLRLTGAGLVGLTLSVRSPEARGDVSLNHYVHVAQNGSISLFSPLADMGQGIFTTLPMILAEEMDLDWQRVRLRLAPTDEAFGNPARNEQYAAESKSVRGYFLPLRRLGATARSLLISAAAARWGVDTVGCETAAGEVRHRASGRRLGYGELAADAASLPIPGEVKLKPVSEFRLLGRAPARRDVAAKSLGSERYGIDIRRPGMRYAAGLSVCRELHAAEASALMSNAQRLIGPGEAELRAFEAAQSRAEVAASFDPASLRQAISTRSPRSAKARTAAAPKPLLAPVMTMVLSGVGMGHSPACTFRYRLVRISDAPRQDIKYRIV